MSEENEHATEEMEMQDETSENKANEKSKNETEMITSQSETAMLEDEEMPTYVSISTASRHDESYIDNTKQTVRAPIEEDHSRSPYPSEDQGAGSIYVLSSGEDSDHPPYNDEEEEYYPDSEDMDDMDIEHDHNNPMLDEEEEEADEDEDEDHPMRMNTDDEEIDGEFEPDCFDRASDDFILTNKLKPQHKRRGLSLQDLTVSKNSVRTYNGKRYSLNIGRSVCIGYSPAFPLHSNDQKKPAPHRYKHVESKVKQYIKDIKKQNRRSTEKRMKEEFEDKSLVDIKDSDITQQKPNRIKSYLERAIKDIQDCESMETYNATRLLENGQNEKTETTVEQCRSTEKDISMNMHRETIENNKETVNNEEKLEKRNGAVETSIQKHNSFKRDFENKLDFGVNTDELSLVNGYQQTPTLFNLRTLSYEEYMHCSNTSSQKPEVELKRNLYQMQENTETMIYNNPEVISVSDMDSSNVTCSLKIENVQSIGIMSEESKDQAANLHFDKVNQIEKQNAENSEIITLKSQLSQKSAQFNILQDTYQKVFADYMKMKQEMDGLKKKLAKYEEEKQPCETKSVAVQTDLIFQPPIAEKESVEENPSNIKASGNSITSMTSSVRWMDSACSPGISMDPPDLKSILNSDDSVIISENTLRNNNRPLSQAFITSSRILQTLSNITQGKNKVESPLAFNPKKRQNECTKIDQTKENSSILDSSLFAPPSAKKRKATDTFETSPFVQQFKIPNINGQAQRNNLNVESSLKFEEEKLNSRLKDSNQSQNASVDDKNSNIEEVAELDDNVKCYVYREDESSKNRSFLIQAQESKDDESAEKIRIRECGPYLLGNVEVRMSEVNGTINIWGKEISQDSLMESEDELNISKKSMGSKSCHYWKNSPQMRFNGSQIVCSTNKKPKVPSKFNESCTSHLQSPCSSKGYIIDNKVKRHLERPSSPLMCAPTCETYDSPRMYRDESMQNRMSGSHEKLHSYCTRCLDFLERDCNCNRDRCKHEEISFSPKEKLKLKGSQKFFHRNINESKHLHENNSIDTNEVTCKHHVACRRSSWHNVNDHQFEAKCCNTKDTTHMCKPININNPECSNNFQNAQFLNRSYENEEDPLISSKNTTETPEIKQRRSSGKKVRGILMEFLRGCGDCRTTSMSKNSAQENLRKTLPYLAACSPQIKVSPCPSPEPTCSHVPQSNERCSHAYVRRIESQLEEVRQEMERVRSRSDAILDMLNMLHSVDMN